MDNNIMEKLNSIENKIDTIYSMVMRSFAVDTANILSNAEIDDLAKIPKDIQIKELVLKVLRRRYNNKNLRHKYEEQFNHINKNLLKDEEFVISLINMDYRYFRLLEDEYKTYNICKKAMEINSCLYKYIPNKYMKDSIIRSLALDNLYMNMDLLKPLTKTDILYAINTYKFDDLRKLPNDMIDNDIIKAVLLTTDIDKPDATKDIVKSIPYYDKEIYKFIMKNLGLRYALLYKKSRG